MDNDNTGTVSVMVEVPKGSRNKYEYDKIRRRIKLDRMLFSSVHYPCDYGFVEDSLALDGDALDALVLLWEPTFPGCIIEAKPIVMSLFLNGATLTPGSIFKTDSPSSSPFNTVSPSSSSIVGLCDRALPGCSRARPPRPDPLFGLRGNRGLKSR